MKFSECVSISLFKETRMSTFSWPGWYQFCWRTAYKKWYIWVAEQFLEQGTSCEHIEVVQKEETKVCELGVLESSIRTQGFFFKKICIKCLFLQKNLSTLFSPILPWVDRLELGEWELKLSIWLLYIISYPHMHL